MPYCAHCRWEYSGSPRYCRECGQRLFRSSQLESVLPTGELEWPTRLAVFGWSDRQRSVALGLLGAAAAAVFLLTGLSVSNAALTGFPIDEAWVRLVYARSLATEARLAFNPGPPEAAISSALWVGLMALLIKTLGQIGLSVVALAKAASIVAGAVSAALAGSLAARLTGSRAIAWMAGMAAALDPALGFASASGVETTLFTALCLAACVALLDRRLLLAGTLLALATLTRFEGLALVGLAGAAVAVDAGARVRRKLRGGEPIDPRRALWGALLVAPGLLLFVLWGALDGTSDDGLLPRSLYLAIQGIAAGPDPTSLWRGFGATSVWWLRGPLPLITLPLVLLGSVALARSAGTRAIPVVLFPPVLAAGASIVLAGHSLPWGFEQWRLLDPALPFLGISLVVGVAAVLVEGARLWRDRLGSRRWAGAALVWMSVLGAVLPLFGLADLWGSLPREYQRTSRALAETQFALARYVRDELPAESLIASFEPGTLRYVSRRPVADARGLHTRGLTGRSPLEALSDVRGEYAALPRQPNFESWPAATLVREFAPSPPIPGVPPLGLYRVAPSARVAPRDALLAFSTESLRRLDYVDVGNEAAERAHAYAVVGALGTTRDSLRVTAQAAVEDDGRIFAEGETLELQAEIGRDLVVARRSVAGSGVLAVTVDGQPAGEWRARGAKYAIEEDAFRVPGALVRRARPAIQLRLVAGTSPRTTTYAYWSFADR